MKITNTKEPFECGEKRFYMPGIAVEEECPNCERPMVIDYKHEYLMYPMFNEPIKVSLYCGKDDCDGETEVTVMLRLVMEPA